MGAVGLATATSVGLWINLGALIAIAMSRELLYFDTQFGKVLAASGVAALILAILALLGRGPALALGAHFGSLANLVALLALGAVGAIIYGAALVGMLRLMGVSLRSLRGSRRREI